MAGVGPMTQLAATGPQDFMITTSGEGPVKTWQRYTRFALDSNDIRFPSTMGFGSSGRVVIPPTCADIVCNLFFELVLPVVGDGWTWCADVGYRVIERFTMTLGDVVAVDVDGPFHIIANALNLTEGQHKAVRVMTAHQPLVANTEHHLLIPLHMLYSTVSGPGIPLIAMISSRFQIDLSLSALTDVLAPTSSTSQLPATLAPPLCKIIAETAILDGPERAVFLQGPTTLISEWVLFQDFPTAMITNNHDVVDHRTMTIDLSFMQRSVKQIIIVFLDDDGSLQDCLTSCVLSINNSPQGDKRCGDYFGLPSSYRRCLSCPEAPIYTINLALQTSARQPGGCIDMEQIASCTLAVELADGNQTKMRVYSIAYRPLLFQKNVITSV